MKKIFFLLPFLLLAITKCEKPKRRRDLDRERVKSKRRPSAIYRMKQIAVVVGTLSIIILFICYKIYPSKASYGKVKSLLSSLLPKGQLNSRNPSDSDKGEIILSEKKQIFYKRIKDENTPLHIACQEGKLDKVKSLLAKSKNIEEDLNAMNENQNTPFQLACRKGHLDVVETLLAQINKFNINATDGDQRTALHEACICNSPFEEDKPKIVKLLLANGANIEVKDKNGNTPLHEACKWGKLEIVKSLLAESKNIEEDLNAMNENQNTPFQLACRKGHLDVVETLLAQINEFNINATDGDQRTALHEICTCNSPFKEDELEIVKLLLANGANIEVKDKNGNTPLHEACKWGKVEIVKHLVAKGKEKNINIDTKNDDGETALHLAADNNKVEIVDHLMTNGAEVDIKTNHDRTPLHLAAYKGYLEVVKHLVAKGKERNINIDIKDEYGQTPLYLAAQNGHCDVVEALIAGGANLDILEGEQTPLHGAASGSHLHVVKFLFKKYKEKGINANVNAKDKYGFTSLHRACQRFSCWDKKAFNVVKFLLQNEADPNAKSKDGDTPLHCAAYCGNLEVVKHLIKVKKVALDATDKNGDTPLHLAAEKGHSRVVKFLFSNGAAIDATDVYSSTPLSLACIEGHYRVVKFLLEKGAALEAKDKDGETPLYIAAWNNRGRLVKYLLQNGANRNAKDDDGNSVLYCAAKRDNLDVVKLLVEEEGEDINFNVEDKNIPLKIALAKYPNRIAEFLETAIQKQNNKSK